MRTLKKPREEAESAPRDKVRFWMIVRTVSPGVFRHAPNTPARVEKCSGRAAASILTREQKRTGKEAGQEVADTLGTLGVGGLEVSLAHRCY